MSNDQLLTKLAETEAALETASGECYRLTKCLEKANKNHEHFERLYYLEKQKNEEVFEIINKLLKE
jgi:hypothetical protein